MQNTTIQPRNKPPISRAAIMLVLAPAAVVLAASITFLSFRPTEESSKATLVDCQAILEAPSRLACYDGLAKAQVPVPAKGGQAIISPQ
jgi:hypothetical protein